MELFSCLVRGRTRYLHRAYHAALCMAGAMAAFAWAGRARMLCMGQPWRWRWRGQIHLSGAVGRSKYVATQAMAPPAARRNNGTLTLYGKKALGCYSYSSAPPSYVHTGTCFIDDASNARSPSSQPTSKPWRAFTLALLRNAHAQQIGLYTCMCTPAQPARTQATWPCCLPTPARTLSFPTPFFFNETAHRGASSYLYIRIREGRSLELKCVLAFCSAR